MTTSSNNVDLVSIVIPAYNESESMMELYERIKRVMDAIDQRFECIFVDDGSTDKSIDVLMRLKRHNSNVGIISHRKNHGKSMALMQGFAAARGDVAIMMDADLQDEPENIPAMLTKLSEGYDLVNGYRADRKDTRLKRLVSRVFNIITTHLFKTDVHDINCGFKVIRRDLYKMLELRGDLHRLIPALASGYGFKVAEVEVTHVDRKHGSSKYKLLRHRGLLDIIALMAALTTRYRPFHVFCEIALILWALVLCDLVGIIILAKRSVSSAALLGDTAFIILAFVGLVLMLSGIVLPVVGLILDILSAPQQDARWRGTLVCKQALPETK